MASLLGRAFAPGLYCLVFALGITAANAQPSPTSDRVAPVSPAESISERAQTLSRLTDLREQIQDREKELKTLRRATRGVAADSLDAVQKRLLKELPGKLEKLEASFEQIAVNGLDLTVLSNEQSGKYDWEAELVEIVRPVIGSMKSLTEKPRRIEGLRQEIRRSELQEQTLNKALASLAVLQQGKTGPIGKNLHALNQRWQELLDQTISSRQVFKYQLDTLEKGDETSAWESANQQFQAFVQGRGITLAILVSAILGIWSVSRLGLSLAMRLARRAGEKHPRRSRERAMRYLYRAISGLIMIGAALVVFYLRSDMLLLALSIIGLVMAAAGLRQAVPRYITEIRILMGFGSVREGERMVFNNIPMGVRSINAFAKLENPALDGTIRIPLNTLTEYSSRPRDDEPWFPCAPDDFVLFGSNRFGQVVAQSVENVRLRVLGSPIQIATSEFLAMSPVNLTREGFVVSASFGIDYQHQSICLDEVPVKMKAAITASMASADYGDSCANVSVEFKEAAASSLDYLILIRMNGDAAGNYFGISRRVQQTLVALSNQEHWSIPFGQLTVHAGDGLMSRAVESEISKPAVSVQLPRDSADAGLVAQ